MYNVDDKRVIRGRSNRPGENRTLRLPKVDLTFIRVDHQTRLQFETTQVMIETSFSLRIGDVQHWLDPEVRAGLGPILALYPDTLVDGSVDDEATLCLRFASGAVLTVPQDPDYEAWQVDGPDDYLVVCTIGTDGHPAVWG